MKRNVKFLIIMATLLCLAWVLGAESAPAKEFMSIGTHPVGSFFNVVGTAVAKVVSDHSDVVPTVKPMKGPVAWLPFMERDSIDLGVLNMWDAEKSWLGESVYSKLSGGKGFPVRLVAISVNNLGCLVVAKDSGIFSYSDLKGKRVGGNMPVPSLQLQIEAYLANGGVKWSEVTPVPVNSVQEAVAVVIDGRADASGAAALGMPIIDELHAKKGARLLQFDTSQEALARTRQFFPGYPVKVAPGPGNTGIEKEGYLWGYDIYLICRSNYPDDKVYDVMKILWDHHQELGKIHAGLKAWKPEIFLTNQFIVPYHPGAVRLFKEKGVWTKEMANIQEELLKKEQK
jgi:TRAP transporter TAXI family solute receptor